MNIDFLGHASILVGGIEGTALFDPLLFGVHHEGLYDVHPRRELDIAQIPALDAVFISHAHLDHFDLHSLALLPRELPIHCAADPLLIGCLDGLGFSTILPLRNFVPIMIGTMEIVPTPGAPGTTEHGFVVREKDAVTWNLVDTFPTPATIAEVRRRHPEIHLAIVPWQPLQDRDVLIGGSRGFPYEMYAALVANVLRIDARYLVPGACGFRAIGPNAWMNRVLFPVTRPRFVEDITRANAAWNSRVLEMDPGDRILLTQEVCCSQKNQVEYCKAEPYGWEEISFRPHEAGRLVAEHRGALFSVEASQPFARAFFEEHLPRLIDEECVLFDEHRRYGVRHEFEVVFADERRAWTLDFSRDRCAVTPGRCATTDASTIVTASLLTGLVAETISWDFAEFSGDYRHHNRCYSVDACGVHAPHAARLPDPLRVVFGARSMREKCYAAQVERLVAASK